MYLWENVLIRPTSNASSLVTICTVIAKYVVRERSPLNVSCVIVYENLLLICFCLYVSRSLAWFSNYSLYLPHNRSISTDAVLILRYLYNSSLRMYNGAFAMVLRIMDFNASTLAMFHLPCIPIQCNMTRLAWWCP